MISYKSNQNQYLDDSDKNEFKNRFLLLSHRPIHNGQSTIFVERSIVESFHVSTTCLSPIITCESHRKTPYFYCLIKD